MYGVTKTLILCLLMGSVSAFSQTNETLKIVVNDDTRIVLRRTSYFNEFLPDTSFITNRRAELNREKLRIAAEWRMLDTLRTDWQTAKGAGAESVTEEPAQVVIQPAPATTSPAFAQTRTETATKFECFTADGQTLLLVELMDNGQVWVNRSRWIYNRNKKQFTKK